MKCRTALCLALVIPAMALMTGHAENPPQNIKDFVGEHYKELQDDLHQGDGVSLTSLLSLLHTQPEEKVETIKRLRALSEAYPIPSEFVDRVPDFAHEDQATPLSAAVPSVPAASESDLMKLFGPMKYKTRIHLSMVNGDEIDGTFSSFDKSREIIFVNPASSSSMFGKKVYALRNIKNVSQIPAK